jgi:hypothetical protein
VVSSLGMPKFEVKGNQIFVVEKFVASKSSDRASQDVVFASEIFAAVIDGATTTFPCACCGLDAGRLAATNVASTLGSLNEKADLATTLHEIRRGISDTTAALPCGGESWAASMPLLSFSRRQLWVVGDVTVLLDGTQMRWPKKVDRVASDFRAAMVRATLAGGADIAEIRAEDPGRGAIIPLLQAQVAFRNNARAGSYALQRSQRSQPQ